MRKLILGMSVTTDGFVCGPNGEKSEWFNRTRDPSVKEWLETSFSEAGVHIMGRSTFENIAPYWATSTDQLAETMNKISKVVFSQNGFVPQPSYGAKEGATSSHTSTWANAIVATNLVADITKLKQQEGKPVLALGGASFAQELVRHGLVDEYRFVIHPVVIGKGISVFAATPHLIDLQLVSSTPYPSGIIINIYTPKSK